MNGPERDDIQPSFRASWPMIAVLGFGYVAIYLCRKNLGVAVPLIQTSFATTKAQVGWIASAGTLAYALGKVLNGPVVDRIGGRAGFVGSLLGVALFAAGTVFAPSLGFIALFYGLNRFAGAAGWGSMIKLVPTWFEPKRAAGALAVLSISYVAGGVAATMLARAIVTRGGGWRAVMGAPALVVLVAALIGIVFVRRGPVRLNGVSERSHGFSWPAFGALFRHKPFLVSCALSFVVTLVREAFNTWSVDFLTTLQGGAKSLTIAALQSTGFDVAGVLGILSMGFVYARLRASRKRWLLAGALFTLAGVLALMPTVRSPILAASLVAVTGFLVYGPFSLLSGVMALESGGARLISTAAGVIDGVGYVAGGLAGVTLGRLLDVGGYALGFSVLAMATIGAAGIALLFEPRAQGSNTSTEPGTVGSKS